MVDSIVASISSLALMLLEFLPLGLSVFIPATTSLLEGFIEMEKTFEK